MIKNKDNDFHKSLNKYMLHNQSIQTFEYWMTGQYNEYNTKIEQINMDYSSQFMDQFEETESNIDGINPHLEEYRELLQEVLTTVHHLSKYVREGPSTTELIQHMAERIENYRQETLMLMNIVNTSGMDTDTREQLNTILQQMNQNTHNLLA
jgi:methyl-accepting chemotaxis protein